LAKKKGLFKGGGRSVLNKMLRPPSRPDQTTIDTSLSALEKRAEARNTLPLLSLTLSLKAKVRKDKPVVSFKENYVDLSAKYPEQELLIKQLCLGYELHYSGRIIHTSQCDRVRDSIYYFVEFLNDTSVTLNKKVTAVSEIDVFICKAYVNWIYLGFDSTSPRRSYSSIKRSVLALKKKYGANEKIGQVFSWPPGPAKNENPTEGIGLKGYKELSSICKAEIKEVMALHLLYKNIHLHEEPFKGEVWNLNNLMYLIRESELGKKRTDEELIRKGLGYKAKKRDGFLKSEGLSVDDVIKLWELKGPELAKKGVAPDRNAKKGVIWNIENLMAWIECLLINSKYRYSHIKGNMRRRISRAKPKKWIDENGLTVDAVLKMYYECGDELVGKGRSPYKDKIPKIDDVWGGPNEKSKFFKKLLVTLKDEFEEFPFYMSLEDGGKFFKLRQRFSLIDKIQDEKKEIYDLTRRCIGIARWPLFGEMSFRQSVYGSMHFVAETIYPFYLLVMLNTGWNSESILAITDDVDKHVEPDLIDPDNYVVIISTKERGQSSKKDGAKSIYHRCNKNEKFGTYRLLKYVESIVIKYRESPHYINGKLWQYAIPHGSRRKNLISLMGSASTDIYYMSLRFIERNDFKYITEKTIDHKKVRSGYSSAREALGLTEFEIREDLDHEGYETTSVSYASDRSSNKIKDIKIAEIQKQFVEEVNDIKIKKVTSMTLSSMRKAINESKDELDRINEINSSVKKTGLPSQTIIHLLDVDSQKYISACENSMAPTWPNHERFVKKGQKCRFFNKCCLCDKSVLFPEALPYVAKRILVLEELKDQLSGVDWIVNYGDEFDAWSQILDVWSNKSEVEEAKKLASSGLVFLPHLLRGV
jgi:hypothetical protein